MKVVATYREIPFQMLLHGQDKEAYEILAGITETEPVVVIQTDGDQEASAALLKRVAKKADIAIMVYKPQTTNDVLVQRYFGQGSRVRQFGQSKSTGPQKNASPEVLQEAFAIWKEKGRSVADWENANGQTRAPYINGAMRRLEAANERESVQSPAGVASA